MRGRLLYLCVGEPDPGVGGREEWSGSARRANRREIVDWCEVWR